MGHFVAFCAEPDSIEARLDSAFPCGAFAPSRRTEHKIQIVGCGAVGEQGKILEDDAQIPPQRMHVFAVDGVQVMSAHGSLAMRQGALAVKALQQRTLSRTCFANQVNQFTGANGQIDVLQYGVLGDGYAAIFDVNQGEIIHSHSNCDLSTRASGSTDSKVSTMRWLLLSRVIFVAYWRPSNSWYSS